MFKLDLMMTSRFNLCLQQGSLANKFPSPRHIQMSSAIKNVSNLTTNVLNTQKRSNSQCWEESEEESTAISIPARVCARTVFRADSGAAAAGGIKVSLTLQQSDSALSSSSSYQSELFNPAVLCALSAGSTLR